MFLESSHGVSGGVSLKGFVSIEIAPGRYALGTINQTVLTGRTLDELRIAAWMYAGPRRYKLEIYYDHDKVYGDPDRVETG